MGIKELDNVEGWPADDASLVFKDRKATYTSTWGTRLFAAGANPVGLCTASEFGGLNVSVSKLNGVTGNAWNPSRTAGGSSAEAPPPLPRTCSDRVRRRRRRIQRIPAAFNGLLA